MEPRAVHRRQQPQGRHQHHCPERRHAREHAHRPRRLRCHRWLPKPSLGILHCHHDVSHRHHHVSGRVALLPHARSRALCHHGDAAYRGKYEASGAYRDAYVEKERVRGEANNPPLIHSSPCFSLSRTAGGNRPRASPQRAVGGQLPVHNSGGQRRLLLRIPSRTRRPGPFRRAITSFASSRLRSAGMPTRTASPCMGPWARTFSASGTGFK